MAQSLYTEALLFTLLYCRRLCLGDQKLYPVRPAAVRPEPLRRVQRGSEAVQDVQRIAVNKFMIRGFYAYGFRFIIVNVVIT